MPSSSGRAAMTREAREGPWVELGTKLATIPWPRAGVVVRAERLADQKAVYSVIIFMTTVGLVTRRRLSARHRQTRSTQWLHP